MTLKIGMAGMREIRILEAVFAVLVGVLVSANGFKIYREYEKNPTFIASLAQFTNDDSDSFYSPETDNYNSWVPNDYLKDHGLDMKSSSQVYPIDGKFHNYHIRQRRRTPLYHKNIGKTSLLMLHPGEYHENGPEAYKNTEENENLNHNERSNLQPSLEDGGESKPSLPKETLKKTKLEEKPEELTLRVKVGGYHPSTGGNKAEDVPTRQEGVQQLEAFGQMNPSLGSPHQLHQQKSSILPPFNWLTNHGQFPFVFHIPMYMIPSYSQKIPFHHQYQTSTPQPSIHYLNNLNGNHYAARQLDFVPGHGSTYQASESNTDTSDQPQNEHGYEPYGKCQCPGHSSAVEDVPWVIGDSRRNVYDLGRLSHDMGSAREIADGRRSKRSIQSFNNWKILEWLFNLLSGL